MKAKHQRLVLAVIALAAIIGAAFLALYALQDKASYFYTPSDIAKNRPAAGQAIRLGGMVADKSIRREADGVTVHFIVKDSGSATTSVIYRGVTPELFKENSGVIADGKMQEDGTFLAETLLAKHDERYVPPQMASAMNKGGAMHKTGSVSK